MPKTNHFIFTALIITLNFNINGSFFIGANITTTLDNYVDEYIIAGKILGKIIQKTPLTIKFTNGFSGNGCIEGNKIEIYANYCNFTGTIKCSDTCKIYVKKPFDSSMFKQEGNGKFSIIVQ